MAVAELSVEAALAGSVGPGRLIADGARVLVGLSGGPDSMALLHGLHAMARGHGLALQACFIDHGLRPVEADRTAAEGLCRALGIVLRVEVIEARALADRRALGVEGAAREVRLARLEAVRRALGADSIALGHQADDQAETVLMRLVRGSAARGLGAMDARRGVIVRPLLGVRRAEILRYIARWGLSPAHDESNDDPRFVRNRIRHDLLPKLVREYNPRLVERLVATARSLREDEELLGTMAGLQRNRLERTTPGTVSDLDHAGLRALHAALRRRIVRAVLEQSRCRVTHRVIEGLLAWIEGPGTGAHPLPGGLAARIVGGRLVFIARSSPLPVAAVLPVGVALRLPQLDAVLRADLLAGPVPPPADRFESLFLAEAVRFPLRLRQRRPGDRIEPRGMHGTRKLQDLLVDLKIPRWRRDAVLLLVDAHERILWVVGVRRTRVAATDGGAGQILRVHARIGPNSPLVVIEKEGMVH